jgi:ribosomal protein S18 acetylase RimI-like enzyme
VKLQYLSSKGVDASLSNPVIRQARKSDRQVVLDFTKDTFPWGDYIYRVFDRWLADTSGRLLVAELDGTIVGLSFVKLTKEGEVWLQGGRVDKRFRRTGIGGAMIKECLRIAKQDMSASVARVITDKTNLPPQRLLAKLGFDIATDFTELQKQVKEARIQINIPDAEIADKEVIPEVWNYLKRSPIFRKASCLYTKWFVWYTLSEEDLRRFVSEAGALIYDPKGKVHGVMLFDDTTPEAKAEKSIQSCYFDADTNKGVEALSSYLVNLAASKGLEKVRLWTCSDKKIVNSLKEGGFGGEIDESTEVVWMRRL